MAVSAGQRVSGWTGQCVPGFKARSPLIPPRHLASTPADHTRDGPRGR